MVRCDNQVLIISTQRKETIMSTIKTPAPTVKLHSFAACAKRILNADARAASTKAQAINAWLDKYIRTSDLPKTSAGAELLRAHVAQCEVIPTEQRNTFRAYASGMVYAWVHGVPWTSTITQQGLGLPWSDTAKKSSAAKTSAAKSAKPRGRAAGKATGARPKTGNPASANVSSEAPNDAREVRAHVQKVANELSHYLQAHIIHADLATRDVVQHFAAAVAKLPKLPDETAPM